MFSNTASWSGLSGFQYSKFQALWRDSPMHHKESRVLISPSESQCQVLLSLCCSLPSWAAFPTLCHCAVHCTTCVAPVSTRRYRWDGPLGSADRAESNTSADGPMLQFRTGHNTTSMAWALQGLLGAKREIEITELRSAEQLFVSKNERNFHAVGQCR